MIGKIKDGHIFGEYAENGFIYKNEDAFANHPEHVCYVPEYGFDETEYVDEESNNAYTYNDLLSLCDGNKELCKNMFAELSWEFPETWLTEYNYNI
jgi:hypothetical protein